MYNHLKVAYKHGGRGLGCTKVHFHTTYCRIIQLFYRFEGKFILSFKVAKVSSKKKVFLHRLQIPDCATGHMKYDSHMKG